MLNEKSIFVSKTFWGAAIAGISAIVGLIWHVNVSDTDQQTLIDVVTSIITAIGSVIAIYGRTVANKEIKR